MLGSRISPSRFFFFCWMKNKTVYTLSHIQPQIRVVLFSVISVTLVQVLLSISSQRYDHFSLLFLLPFIVPSSTHAYSWEEQPCQVREQLTFIPGQRLPWVSFVVVIVVLFCYNEEYSPRLQLVFAPCTILPLLWSTDIISCLRCSLPLAEYSSSHQSTVISSATTCTHVILLI